VAARSIAKLIEQNELHAYKAAKDWKSGGTLVEQAVV